MSNFELQSLEINELAKAVCKLQAEIEGATKGAINPHLRSKYADLKSVWEAAREPLAKNDLCVIQTADAIDNNAYLITTLLHSSGQWIRGRYPLNPVKQDPQAYGSAVTYARRYMLSSILGITADDDDGIAASQPQRIKMAVASSDPYLTSEQQQEKIKVDNAKKWTDEYIENLKACRTPGEFYSLKNDEKKSVAREKIRANYPFLSEKITEAGEQVKLALGA